MKFLASPDLGRNQARNLTTDSLALSPLIPNAGLRYFDTGMKRERYWDGNTWVDDQGNQRYVAKPTGYTTDASGYITITFPQAFKNANVAVAVSNATPGNPFFLIVPYNWVLAGSFAVVVYGFGGNIIANNAGIVLTWIAVGERP
jgi:hypothetical protein